jgi:hypothetical protein
MEAVVESTQIVDNSIQALVESTQVADNQEELHEMSQYSMLCTDPLLARDMLVLQWQPELLTMKQQVLSA